MKEAKRSYVYRGMVAFAEAIRKWVPKHIADRYLELKKRGYWGETPLTHAENLEFSNILVRYPYVWPYVRDAFDQWKDEDARRRDAALLARREEQLRQQLLAAAASRNSSQQTFVDPSDGLYAAAWRPSVTMTYQCNCPACRPFSWPPSF